MDEPFFDDVYRDMKTHQKRLFDEAQQYRLASQGPAERGGAWSIAAGILSWIRCRVGIWPGGSQALQETETPC